ncbi:MAG TPA: lysylphosphatidylglycerol synthase transmembrane domain-containing protein [Patescibacteria group bacterium]
MDSTKRSNKKKKKIIFSLAKLLVSATFIVWVVYKVKWTEVFFYLGQIKIWHIFIYTFFVICGIIISAHKWKMLSDYKGIKLPFGDFFKYYLTGTFINNFMPSFIGGDTFRAYQIGKPDKKYMEAASTVLIDRLTGFVGATILVIIFSLLNLKTILKNDLLLFIDSLVLLSLFFDIFLATARRFSFWEKMHNLLPKKLSDLIRELDHYNHNSKILLRSIGWSMLFALVGVALSNYVLFLSLGVKIGILDYLSVIFLISIVSAIPISINNIGIKEWAFVTFFGFFGVDPSIVIAIAIISRFLQMLLSFLALPVYLESKVKEVIPFEE